MSALTGLDDTGFTSTGDGAWVNAGGVNMRVQFFDTPAELPFPVADERALLYECARDWHEAGAGLIESWIDYPGGLPALFQFIKTRPEGLPGHRYRAWYVVPRATCHLQIDVWADEGADAGRRQSFVKERFGTMEYVPGPTVPLLKTSDGRTVGYDIADSPGIDDMFPNHALSQVRKALRQIFPSLRFADWFRSLPA